MRTPRRPESEQDSGPARCRSATFHRPEGHAPPLRVAALLAHGRKETVRADNAEATLKATLHQLEQLRLQHRTERPRAGDLPRRVAQAPAAPTPDTPTDQPGDPPRPSTGDTPYRERPEPARLQVVERTLQEVMALLHRLAG